jgi:hypothetical protein
MFKLSNRATLDEINKLIELQLLKPKGKGKALHYNKNGMCVPNKIKDRYNYKCDK